MELLAAPLGSHTQPESERKFKCLFMAFQFMCFLCLFVAKQILSFVAQRKPCPVSCCNVQSYSATS